MPSRFVVCASKEEAVEAAEAGLLWINMAARGEPMEWEPQKDLNVAKVYGGPWWPKQDFAVLVEE